MRRVRQSNGAYFIQGCRDSKRQSQGLNPGSVSPASQPLNCTDSWGVSWDRIDLDTRELSTPLRLSPYQSVDYQNQKDWIATICTSLLPTKSPVGFGFSLLSPLHEFYCPLGGYSCPLCPLNSFLPFPKVSLVWTVGWCCSWAQLQACKWPLWSLGHMFIPHPY